MNKLVIFFIILIYGASANAQENTDSIQVGTVTINKDPRVDLLGRKMAEYNAALAYNASRTAKGFRLMVLSTNDRDAAMRLRSSLLQQYPDQGVYMTFQSPYIKLKFGNFLEKDDAEKMRKELIARKIVSGNIYLVPETIEVKPDKNALLLEE